MIRAFKRTELKKYQVQKYFDTILSSKESYIYNNNQLIFHVLTTISVSKFINQHRKTSPFGRGSSSKCRNVKKEDLNNII